MELVSICLMALGLCLRGEQLLLIRGRLDCNSNVFFSLDKTIVLKRQQSAISYGCCGLMCRK